VAERITSFKHFCTCGGFAWTMNGRDPASPHLSWCPQRQEYAAWWSSLPLAEQQKIAERSAKG